MVSCATDFQVARDRVVKGWNFAEALGDVDPDYGSGYPNGNSNTSRSSLPAHLCLFLISPRVLSFRPQNQSVAPEVPGPCVWLPSVCPLQLEHCPNPDGQ